MSAMTSTKFSQLIALGREHAPDHNLLTRRIHSLSRAFRNQTADLLSSTGLLPTQWNLLSLMQTTNASSTRDLLKATDLGKVLVSRTLQGMEQSGMIVRFKDPADLRVDRFEITEKGLEMYERARPVMEARRDAVEHCIGDADREVAQTIFDALDTVVARRDF